MASRREDVPAEVDAAQVDEDAFIVRRSSGEVPTRTASNLSVVDASFSEDAREVDDPIASSSLLELRLSELRLGLVRGPLFLSARADIPARDSVTSGVSARGRLFVVSNFFLPCEVCEDDDDVESTVFDSAGSDVLRLFRVDSRVAGDCKIYVGLTYNQKRV